MPSHWPVIVFTFLGSALTVGLIFAGSLLRTGEVEIGRVETIHGLPYSHQWGATHVDEPLAHADIYLNQPVFAQELILSFEFTPVNISSLAVGVRENEFWLSYPRVILYRRPELPRPKLPLATTFPKVVDRSAGFGPIRQTVTIPLTDKLQEIDQSLDLMLFAEGEQPEWELVNISATVKHVRPSYAQFKDYARAILTRERAH